jgi:hypothetical protein
MTPDGFFSRYVQPEQAFYLGFRQSVVSLSFKNYLQDNYFIVRAHGQGVSWFF